MRKTTALPVIAAILIFSISMVSAQGRGGTTGNQQYEFQLDDWSLVTEEVQKSTSTVVEFSCGTYNNHCDGVTSETKIEVCGQTKEATRSGSSSRAATSRYRAFVRATFDVTSCSTGENTVKLIDEGESRSHTIQVRDSSSSDKSVPGSDNFHQARNLFIRTDQNDGDFRYIVLADYIGGYSNGLDKQTDNAGHVWGVGGEILFEDDDNGFGNHDDQCIISTDYADVDSVSGPIMVDQESDAPLLQQLPRIYRPSSWDGGNEWRGDEYYGEPCVHGDNINDNEDGPWILNNQPMKANSYGSWEPDKKGVVSGTPFDFERWSNIGTDDYEIQGDLILANKTTPQGDVEDDTTWMVCRGSFLGTVAYSPFDDQEYVCTSDGSNQNDWIEYSPGGGNSGGTAELDVGGSWATDFSSWSSGDQIKASFTKYATPQDTRVPEPEDILDSGTGIQVDGGTVTSQSRNCVEPSDRRDSIDCTLTATVSASSSFTATATLQTQGRSTSIQTDVTPTNTGTGNTGGSSSTSVSATWNSHPPSFGQGTIQTGSSYQFSASASSESGTMNGQQLTVTREKWNFNTGAWTNSQQIASKSCDGDYSNTATGSNEFQARRGSTTTTRDYCHISFSDTVSSEGNYLYNVSITVDGSTAEKSIQLATGNAETPANAGTGSTGSSSVTLQDLILRIDLRYRDLSKNERASLSSVPPGFIPDFGGGDKNVNETIRWLRDRAIGLNWNYGASEVASYGDPEDVSYSGNTYFVSEDGIVFREGGGSSAPHCWSDQNIKVNVNGESVSWTPPSLPESTFPRASSPNSGSGESECKDWLTDIDLGGANLGSVQTYCADGTSECYGKMGQLCSGSSNQYCQSICSSSSVSCQTSTGGSNSGSGNTGGSSNGGSNSGTSSGESTGSSSSVEYSWWGADMESRYVNAGTSACSGVSLSSDFETLSNCQVSIVNQCQTLGSGCYARFLQLCDWLSLPDDYGKCPAPSEISQVYKGGSQ